MPTFSYEEEHVLKEEKCAFESEGKTIRLTRDQNHDSLDETAAETDREGFRGPNK